MPEKGDLRVRRTQKMLQEALIDLTAERGFDAISVGDIAARAMVNRATFYRHYQDKYALVEKIFEEAIDQMIQSVGPPRLLAPNFDTSRPSPHWVRLFEHSSQHAKLYEAMLGPRGNPWFVERMREGLAQMIREREELRTQVVFAGQQREFSTMPLEVLAQFAASFIIGTIAWWLNAGQPYSPEQMAGWLSGFLVRSYLYYLQPLPTPAEK